MKFHDEAIWVNGVSEHTGEPKTQICLPIRCDQMVCQDGNISQVPKLARVGRTVYVTGENGGPPLGQIEILSIAQVDVRHTLSDASVRNCGFASRRLLLEVWAYRHDNEFYNERLLGVKKARIRRLISKRPFHNYLAWLITFKPV